MGTLVTRYRQRKAGNAMIEEAHTVRKTRSACEPIASMPATASTVQVVAVENTGTGRSKVKRRKIAKPPQEVDAAVLANIPIPVDPPPSHIPVEQVKWTEATLQSALQHLAEADPSMSYAGGLQRAPFPLPKINKQGLCDCWLTDSNSTFSGITPAALGLQSLPP